VLIIPSYTFKYDPFGRRINKSSSSGTSVYAYDGDNLVEETNGSGGVVARYSQGLNIDEPLAMLRNATTSYYQADGLGSVTSLSNGAGAVAQNYTYDSFGNIIATTGSLVNSFRYTGREWDTETSLYYYRARYYDPSSGRFLTEDPFGFGGGINFYAYAANSSPNLKDPFGLDYTVYKSVMGPGIYVNASITLYGPGATDALAVKWQKDILDAWNNNPGFEKCQVTFNVKVMNDPNAKDARHAVSPAGYPGANNFIYVPLGDPGGDLGDPRINTDLSTGTIPSGTLSFTVAHEFGHLLHLFDSNRFGLNLNPWRPKDDIMNEGLTISSYDINRIIGSKVPSCQCQ
jgi:RHS repeat-associated protein